MFGNEQTPVLQRTTEEPCRLRPSIAKMPERFDFALFRNPFGIGDVEVRNALGGKVTLFRPKVPFSCSFFDHRYSGY
jgi:hypothetical protein